MNFENFFRGPWRRFRTFITQRLAGGTRTVRSLEKIAVSVDDPAGYRARLRVRMAKALTIDATSLTALVAGKEVTIKSQRRDEQLNTAKWVVFHARGFSTENDACEFGTRLRSILQVTSLSLRAGVDVGEDKPSSWASEEFARKLGLIKDHERLAPNIHGLSVLPDDDLTRFPLFDAQATVTSNPDDLVATLNELGEFDGVVLGDAANGVRLLNLALMTNEPLAQMVLAFSAVEEVGQDQMWSQGQLTLIKQLAETAESFVSLDEGDRKEVARAIRTGIFKLSLRQGVMRLLMNSILPICAKSGIDCMESGVEFFTGPLVWRVPS